MQQKVFAIPNTRHQFEVIRLWEIPTEELLHSSGLWPLAMSSQTDDPVNILQEIGQKIDSLDNPRKKSNIAASTAILAGLLLEEEVIQTILRSEIMRESVIYQRIESEGIRKGKQQEGTSLILRQLKRRFTTIPAEIEMKINKLPIEKLEYLGKALLDFQSEQDLINWF